MNTQEIQELVNKRMKWLESTKENKFDFENILEGLYSDPSHFVYEILQNAEDEGAKTVTFHLYNDRLEIYHNGKDFDFKDFDAITSIGKSPKKEDLTAIGKFGIGFKSVYAITNSPYIYSGSFNFRIDDYVVPVPINIKKGEGTKIELPFNHKKRTKEEIFNIVKTRLENISVHNLLFLRKIELINWEIEKDKKGYYQREVQNLQDNSRKVWLTSFPTKEEWIVFDRPINTIEKILRVEIAFKIESKEKNKKTIVPVKGAKLVAFFLTDIETHLKFLIQGPYRTTPARDNIPLDETRNKELIKETSILVAESISKIKELGLLNVDYLDTLLITSDTLSINPSLKPLYEKLKEKLNSGEELLPTYDGKYVSAQQALIGIGKDLRDLLSSEDLKILFNNRTKWIDETITKDKYPEIRKYLMEELNIPEIDAERFARELAEDFIKEHSDEWITKFYGFLLEEHESLWRKKTSFDKEGILRSKPIIRLNDNSHTKPFESDGKPLAWLPSKLRKSLPTVKENIVLDKKAKEFLKNKLELQEPDNIDGFIMIVLPRYMNSEKVVTDEKNLINVGDISKTLKDPKYVSPPKRVMLPIANKCISTNLPIFYHILHVLETMNNPFSKNYLYNQMSKTFLPQSVPQVMAS